MYPRNRAGPAALVLLLFSLAHLGSPPQAAAQKERSTLISEFLADNEEGLPDSNGDRHDWIELHNPGTTQVNLRGYFLTDTPEELDRWRFPELIIPPRGYAVVYAAGVEPGELAAETRLHTSFRLRSDGEYLALVAPDGVTVLSEFSPGYPRQFEDVSYGRDALGREGYYIEPTPGEPNGDGVIGFLDSPAFSVERGCYEEPFTLELSSSDPLAAIRFTTDGSAPAGPSDGAAYRGPIEISRTATVRAASFREGYEPSDVMTHTYVFPSQVVSQSNDQPGYPASWAGRPADYEMDPEVVGDNDLFNGVYRESIVDDLKDIPTLSIVMSRDDLFGSRGIYLNSQSEGVGWERPASVELFDPEGEEEGFQVNCGIRIQGGSSRSPNFPKHSFRLLFKRDYGPGKLRYPLFEAEPQGSNSTDEFDTVVLRAFFNNSWTHWHWYQNPRAQYLRDQFIRDSQLAMGQPSPHGRFVHLYINGLYWGFYNLHERPSAPFMAAYGDGEREDYDVQNVTTAVDGNLSNWNRMMSIANSGVSSADGYARIRELLDVDNLIDYMLLNFYLGNDDWDGHNWYAGSKREGGPGYQFFCWDSELIISRHQNNPPPPQPDLDIILNRDRTGLNNNNKPTRLYNALRANPEFRLRFADRVHKHFYNDGALGTDKVLARWLTRRDQVWRAVVAESARWGDFRRDVLQGSGSREQYDLFHRNQHYVAYQQWLLNTYFPRRRNIFLAQLARRELVAELSPPALEPHGGTIPAGGGGLEVGISVDIGTIYFTTDGSDPRLEGGAASPAASRYSDPLTLEGTTTLKARVLRRGNWSSLAEAQYTADLSPLRITELMYHPRPEEEEGGHDPGDFEFIELWNSSPATLDLTGASIEGGIRFDFSAGGATSLQPGERLLIVENLEAFASRYDLERILVAGEFSGNLSNGGETFSLIDSSGAETLRISYNDSWHPETDGGGPSLQLIDPLTDGEALRSPGAWRPSSVSDGTPGLPDPGAPPGGLQVPGDLNQDGGMDISDSIALLGHLFLGSPARLPCQDGNIGDPANLTLLDVNGDEELNLTDAIHSLAYLFMGGAPPALGTECLPIAGCSNACADGQGL
jgi:hypothetical protein